VLKTVVAKTHLASGFEGEDSDRAEVEIVGEPELLARSTRGELRGDEGEVRDEIK
jgi:hypothetical protein